MIALNRLRRKLEVLREDLTRADNNKRYDIEECLALVDIIKKDQDARSENQGPNKANLGDVSKGQAGSRDSL